MTALRFRLLGSPDLVVEGQRTSFKTRKALALLTYLAVEQGSHPRELLADLFWPTANAKDARSSLRMTIRYMRDALGEQSDAVLIATRDSIGLAPSAPLDLDVAALSSARQQIRMPGDTRRVPGALREDVEHAVSRYRGPFLGDEQHFPAARDERRDQVRDGLALTGARRPLDDQALARKHRVDRIVLA